MFDMNINKQLHQGFMLEIYKNLQQAYFKTIIIAPDIGVLALWRDANFAISAEPLQAAII